MEKEIVLKLQTKQVQLVLNALSELPYRTSAETIDCILAQANNKEKQTD